jgi:SAM-dependent methyltransferase
MAFDKMFRRLFPKLNDAIKISPYRLIHDSRYRRSFKRRLYERLGYNYDQWLRTAQIEDWLESLKRLDLENLDVLEVSPGARITWRDLDSNSYESVQFPDFDICEQTTGNTYDIVIADNVLEHVIRPHRAVRNIYDMLKPGGIFYVTTPFMIMVHGDDDYYRWTKIGMRVLLEDAGFSPDGIEIKSWGNRACIEANFDDWKVHGWSKDMRNDANLPVTIWATARKGPE